MHALRCGVQGYAWGSRTLIPEFLGREPDGQPQAELWIGAHPALPSQVMIDGDWVGLDAFVASDPERHLGSTTLARFGPRLPMLMKVLAVEAPLSLQAHPSPAQAKAGFARENEAGIALASPLRSYRDDGAKPELLWALTPFRALGGFLDPEAAATALDAVGGPMLRAWSATIRLRGVDGLRQTVGELLTLPSDEQATLVADVARAAQRAETRDALLVDLANRYPRDAGVVVAALLRRHELAPGEALFAPAGVLHAYLSGLAVEVQASSDNVLRGGLTPKHVDVPELLAALDPAGLAPHVAPRDVGIERFFAVPVDEFAVSIVSIARHELTPLVSAAGPSLLLCVDGEVSVRAASIDANTVLAMSRGQAAFVSAAEPTISVSGTGVLVRSTVGR